MQWQLSLVLGRARSNTKAAATAAHAAAITYLLPQVYYLCASQCTLSDANTSAGKKGPRRKNSIDQDPTLSDSKTGCTLKVFDAADSSAAKGELLRCFSHLHVNGRVRCINSRHNYVYCKCSNCGATAAVTKTNASKWSLSAMSLNAKLPCAGSVVSAPPPPPPPPPVQSPPTAKCCICEDDFQRDALFECPNPAAHLMCKECFELNLSSQIGGDIQAFINRNCAVICSFCSCEGVNPMTSFNMQALLPR